MPKQKLKTVRGAAKRFKKTASGFRHKQSHKRHILTKKSTKRKRQMRAVHLVGAPDHDRVAQMLPHV